MGHLSEATGRPGPRRDAGGQATGDRQDEPASSSPPSPGAPPRLKVLGLYWQTSFWSLGPRKGVSSFFLAPQSFARFGHEIHLSAPRGRGQPAYEEEAGIRIHRYRGATRFDSNPLHILPIRLASRLLRYLYYLAIATWNGVRLGRQIHPDIVIGYHYHSAAAASLVARLLRLPNITRLFGTQLGLMMHSRLRRLGGFMQVIALRARASYIVMHDDGSQGDQIARRLGVPAERLRFWRDGFDPQMYQPGAQSAETRRALGIPADHVVLFCVGRMTSDKRMERLVDVLPDVLRQEARVTLMLVGDGVDRAMIEARVAALGLGKHVRLTGAVSRDELPRYFNLADIFVGVSDRTNVNLPGIEAMSCGKPVVALDVGGTRELVREGETGRLIPLASWRTELPRVLLTLIRDAAARDRMGRAARELVTRAVPTIDERQRMEVDLALRAVAEWRARKAPSGGRQA